MERNLKNVLVISFGFLLLFTAYGGLQSLQVSGASSNSWQRVGPELLLPSDSVKSLSLSIVFPYVYICIYVYKNAFLTDLQYIYIYHIGIDIFMT